MIQCEGEEQLSLVIVDLGLGLPLGLALLDIRHMVLSWLNSLGFSSRPSVKGELLILG